MKKKKPSVPRPRNSHGASRQIHLLRRDWPVRLGLRCRYFAGAQVCKDAILVRSGPRNPNECFCWASTSICAIVSSILVVAAEQATLSARLVDTLWAGRLGAGQTLMLMTVCHGAHTPEASVTLTGTDLTCPCTSIEGEREGERENTSGARRRPYELPVVPCLCL